MPSLNRGPLLPLDLAQLQQKMQECQGPTYWRSLEELAQTEKFQEFLHREFPDQASEWLTPLSRRRFLTLMGASLALAGLSGCSKPPAEKIVPFVKDPEGVIPGRPLFFATAMPLAGIGTGLLVESHMGRPTKVEGNPDHPASLGATDAYAQASILGLYDPDREHSITNLGKVRTWDETLTILRAELKQQEETQGKGIRILTGAISSPTLAGQLDRLFKRFPQARWHRHEPAVSDAALRGTDLAFGKALQPRYHLAQLPSGSGLRADVILALDADFLSTGPGHLRYVREFSSRRSGRVGPLKPGDMNRLYVAESMFTPTGAAADHRLALRSDDIEDLTRAIAARVGVPGVHADPVAEKHRKWVDVVVRDLSERPKGTTVVVAGDGQPPVVHALAHAMNSVLGNIGKTVVYTPPIEAHPENGVGTLEELVRDLKDSKVELLLILGGNPVFTAPANLGLKEFLESKRSEQTPFRVYLGHYSDETAALCHFHIPEAHYLESWGDVRAFDGTVSIIQPLIAPLSGGKSALELISGLLDDAPLTGHELVRAHWQKKWQARSDRSGSFDSFWKTALHNGLITGTAFDSVAVTLRSDFAARLPASPKASEGFEVVFRPDPGVFDGRFANNGWLQELPRPLTKLTWDNAAILSPATARQLGVTYRFGSRGGEHGEVYADQVTLEVDGRKLTMPIWILPGHADGSITLHLGQGRQRGGKVCKKVGFNVYQLRTSDHPWIAGGVKVSKAPGEHLLACTQGHHDMEGRDLVRSATLAEYEKDPHFAQHAGGEHHGNGKEKGEKKTEGESKRKSLSLYDPHTYTGHKWGMVINLGACTGCGACVVACQAENNIPVVGKEQVVRGREMHWLRIDRYFTALSGPEDLRAVHQPIPCMQCENAPCELVCPVQATAHSYDGLNDMVYNRCVGTRYCSNNCPYKVRRFNFLQFADFDTPSLKLMRNPEVTVRSRGVMEKCTYCVQRIRAAEITAESEHRERRNGQQVAFIRDGEVLTACQAVCPAEAIVFGDLTGPNERGEQSSKSWVALLREGPLHYGLLTELNTEPRTAAR
jgi:molybdopterin-containing oxidoreductase family iron-sulfur binding subunit